MNPLKILILALLALIPFSYASGKEKFGNANDEKLIVAYVTSWSDVIPEADDFSVINYAFGHVNETFDGVKIDNPERFRQLMKLKEKNPELKMVLSIGGWGSGRFSEMAASDSLRKAFAENCAETMRQYGFDGIDIDWEYPTLGWANISSSPDDTENFTKLMRDLRAAISEDKLLTLASSSTAKYIDFKSILPVVDYINIMTYDMSDGFTHHSPLYSSGIAPEMTVDKSVKLHREAGVPDEMIVLGLPFYGRGNINGETYYCDFKNIELKDGQHEEWDPESQSPFIADEEGKFVFGYDNPRSIELKCSYILDNNLKGAMFWDFNGDDSEKSLTSAIQKVLRNTSKNNSPDE